MKNILSGKLVAFLAGVCLFLVGEPVHASSPEGLPAEESVEYVEEVLNIGTATVTVRKVGPGISSTVNNVSYGATVHTNRGAFTSSMNPSSNEVVYHATTGTHTVTRIDASPNNSMISIFYCVEKPHGIDLKEIGAKFTIEEGKEYLIVMAFSKPD